MKHKLLKILGMLFSLLPLGAASAKEETAPVVTIACDSLGHKKKQCVASVQAWEKATGHKANIVEAPTGSSNRLAWVQQQFASGSPDIDVFQLDTAWGGMLENHLIDLTPYISKEDQANYYPSLIQNNTVHGKLVAMPWYVDIGLLFYRKDLLEKYGHSVPKTWDELEKVAQDIQDKERASGNDKIWGFVFSGKAFEGLTCNVSEWVSSYQGGGIIDAQGKVIINNASAAKILNKVASWVGKIVPQGALNYAEEDSRGVFQSGNAVFIRHWPYVITLAQSEESPIANKVEIAPLPKGDEDGTSSGTLGGWQLGVSKYSKHPELAADLVKFLTSKQELKDRAIRGGYYPPRMDLYQDPDIKNALPYADLIFKALATAVARPSSQTGLKYNQVSSAVWNTAHKILLKKEPAEKALKSLEMQLNSMSRNGTQWSKK
jgi:trehalose/maltose transport system substrate-binding protein